MVDETSRVVNDSITDLKKQRGVIKCRLTLFANYINKLDRSCLDSVGKTQVQLRIQSAAIFFNEFNNVQCKIEMMVDEKELVSQIEYRESFECQYYSIIALAKHMVGDLEQNFNNSSSISGKSMSIKLPQIKLPAFDGSFDKWLEFRNTYLSMIHDRDDLDPIQKFQYLKSSLSGSALHVISALEFTAANYSNAWDLLEARYQNNRLLVHNHIKALFAAPSLGKECPTQIRTLVDCVLRNLRALNSLKEPESSLEDMLIIYLVVSKLDSATEREWENYRSSFVSDSNKTSKPLKLEDLLAFLNNRSDMLDMINSGKSKNNQSHSQSKHESKQSADHKRQTNSQTTLSYASTSNNNNKVSSGTKSKPNKHNLTCPLCSGKHALFSCVKFLNMVVKDRLTVVQSKGVCQNCLRTHNHTIENCNFGPCKLCQQKHNALIHVETSGIPNTSPQRSVIDNTLPQSSVLHCVSNTADNIDNGGIVFTDSAKSLQTVLLSTALVEIADIDNCYHTVRILLDSGSQNSFITQSLCKRLRVPIIQSTIRVCGVGQIVSQSSHKCDVNLRSKVYDFQTILHCLVLPSIVSKLPSTLVSRHTINIPNDILLADPTFFVPSDIDLLIGADVFWDLLKDNKIKLHTGPYLQDTMVGWIISGPVYNNNNSSFAASMTDVQCNLTLIDSQLRKFWEIEEVLIPPVITEEDRFCEELFLQTTKRDQHGRFSVAIPFKQSPNCLGDSYNSAKRRLLSLEAKLDRSPLYKQMYFDFMQEYEQLGHMTHYKDFNNFDKPYYIIPHHGVYRESSLTTKLRVVFDASATTSNNNSLNEIQYVGPRLQNDIFSILLRFRQYQYVACADIEKFFRQTLIHPEQRNLQLILWRTDNSKPIQFYRLNTVTYGTASAPYLSNRCLKQLAKECTDDVIARVINDDFYVDDLLTGHDQREVLLEICNKTSAILQTGCFPLRKWTFNFDVTSESNKDLCIGEYCQSKTLGVGWSNKNDLFNFSTSVDKNMNTKITKRLIMSVIAQIYDPLGLLAPAITTAKVLLQKLWLAKISWDDEVPGDIACVWYNFINSLQYLSEILVPRCVMCTNAVNKELHIFTDASQSAYGACAYIRSYNIDESRVTSRLLCAKSKVAPIKSLSIPRLELCGALVGAKLYNKITTSLSLQFDKVYFWTDSTIVQGWLRTSPHLLKTFVQNRVVQINELTSNTIWLHVKGKENPADILSRGVLFDSLKGDNNSLWWCGPTFLREPTSRWLIANYDIDLNKLPELKTSKTTNLLNVESNNIIVDFERFSCFNRLQRAVAYVLRFISNIRASRVGQGRETGSLTVNEINNSLVVLTRIVQSQSFSKEYSSLKEKLPLNKKCSNKTLGLGIFLDKDDIIRVGGRLSNSKFNFDKKHPVLLCHKHRFTKLLFSYEHKRLLHAAPQLLVAAMRDRWWVLRARNLARQVIHACVTCTRMKGNTLTPYMGDRPASV